MRAKSILFIKQMLPLSKSKLISSSVPEFYTRLLGPHRTQCEHSLMSPISSFQTLWQFYLQISPNHDATKQQEENKARSKIHIQCKIAQPVSPKQQISEEHSPLCSKVCFWEANVWCKSAWGNIKTKFNKPTRANQTCIFCTSIELIWSYSHHVGNFILFYKDN